MKTPDFLRPTNRLDVGLAAASGGVAIEGGLVVVGAEAGFNAVKSIPTRIKIADLQGDIDHIQNVQAELTSLGVPLQTQEGTDQFLNRQIQERQQKIAVVTDRLPNNPVISEWGPDVLGTGLAAAAFTFVALRTAMLSPRFRRKFAKPA